MGRIPTRRLLAEAMSRHHPGFEAVDGPAGLYWFRESWELDVQLLEYAQHRKRAGGW